MKTWVLKTLLIGLTLIVQNVFCQRHDLANNQIVYSKKVSAFSYFNVNIGLGANPLMISNLDHAIRFNYTQTDLQSNSTSVLSYTSQIHAKPVSGNMSSIDFGLEGGSLRKYFFIANLGFMLNQKNTHYGQIGIGYNLKFKHTSVLMIQPSISYNVSTTIMDYAETIDNHQKDLNIFGTNFPYKKYRTGSKYSSGHFEYSQSVSLKYKNYSGGTKIQLGIWIRPIAKYSVKLNVGYYIPMYTGIRIKANSTNTNASIKYNRSSIDFTQMNNSPANQNISYKGFYGNVMLSLNLTNNRKKFKSQNLLF